MAAFNKLSLVAQYDDLCRLINKYLKIKEEDEEQYIQMLETFMERRSARDIAHVREKDDLKSEIASLQKQIKKLNRELVESRMAVIRETEEKKSISKERRALWEQIRMVRELVENTDNLRNTDNRDKVISYLDLKRLSTIHSDDSSDGASGLEYDRTEEDINIDSDHQPSDSNPVESDDENIEAVRQQLKKHEEQRKEESLAATLSTPNVKRQTSQQLINKAMTLSAKSAATLMRVGSINKSPANTQKPHSFVDKKVFRPDTCGPCGGRIPFYSNCAKCENCGAVCHPECKEKCPLPCVKITAPISRSKSRKILISDFVNSDASPKIPALILHCCNEIERADNILTEGLYRVVARAVDTEALQVKILKSKTGMPNLSREDVHLLCSVVKRFLQNLDESLITTTLWSHFSEAAKSEGGKEERTSHIEFYISNDLPTANRDTLAFFMQHLHAIAKHSAQNKMTTRHLARSLAATVVGNSCRNPSPALIQQENSMQSMIMETLLEIDEKFWSNFVVKSPSNSLGSRLLSDNPASSNSSSSRPRTRGSSRFGATLPTPKLKPLFA